MRNARRSIELAAGVPLSVTWVSVHQRLDEARLTKRVLDGVGAAPGDADSNFSRRSADNGSMWTNDDEITQP